MSLVFLFFKASNTLRIESLVHRSYSVIAIISQKIGMGIRIASSITQ